MATIELHVMSDEYDKNAIAYLRGQLKSVALRYPGDLVLDIDLLRGADSIIGGNNNSGVEHDQDFYDMLTEVEYHVRNFMPGKTPPFPGPDTVKVVEDDGVTVI